MANHMRMQREGEVNSDETCIFETTGTAGTALGGGGDTIHIPRIGRFQNGVGVPIFEAEEIEENPGASNNYSGKGITFSQAMQMMELYKCPLCMDYLFEATAVGCGHIFCSSCLNQSTNMKQICPLCPTKINCRIRLFKQDLFLQSILNSCDDLPEVFQNLNEASKARFEARKSIFLNIRESLESLRCKGFRATFLANSGRPNSIRRHASQSREQGRVSTNFLIGICLLFACYAIMCSTEKCTNIS